MLQIEATCKTEVINIAEYSSTKYKQELFLNTVESKKSIQPNRNSTTGMPATFLEDNGSHYPLSYRVPVRERYGSTLLPATREQHDQNCTQNH